MLNSEEISRLKYKIVSYKSLLLEWSQKKKVKIHYETIEESLPNRGISFKSSILFDGEKSPQPLHPQRRSAEEKGTKSILYTK